MLAMSDAFFQSQALTYAVAAIATFKFLGFVLICDKSRRGDFRIRRKSRRDRMSSPGRIFSY